VATPRAGLVSVLFVVAFLVSHTRESCSRETETRNRSKNGEESPRFQRRKTGLENGYGIEIDQ
jgi:hypothetical protein